MIFTTPRLTDLHWAVLGGVEDLRRRLNYSLSQPLRWSGLLRRTTLARAIQGSNSIEGYHVSVEDAIAAVEGDEPMTADRATWREVTGYREAMTYVLQLANDPNFSYSTGLLNGLHFMMLQHDLRKNPGRWRPGPVSVVDEPKRIVVYEAPDADLVPQRMGELVDGLNESQSLPVLVSAAMAHLNLVMIHPYSDGNGRMSRCLQTLVLARDGILAPQFSSIEEYLGRNTQDYYAVLSKVGGGSWHPENDCEPWLRFCLSAHHRQATTLLRRHREMQKLWDAIERAVVGRHLPERVILALVDAANGYRVRNSSYRNAAEISNNLASRDLKLLVDGGFLVPIGQKRGRVYMASEALRDLQRKTREPRVDADPFDQAAENPLETRSPLPVRLERDTGRR
jgi:Fic family protein